MTGVSQSNYQQGFEGKNKSYSVSLSPSSLLQSWLQIRNTDVQYLLPAVATSSNFLNDAQPPRQLSPSVFTTQLPTTTTFLPVSLSVCHSLVYSMSEWQWYWVPDTHPKPNLMITLKKKISQEYPPGDTGQLYSGSGVAGGVLLTSDSLLLLLLHNTRHNPHREVGL